MRTISEILNDLSSRRRLVGAWVESIHQSTNEEDIKHYRQQIDGLKRIITHLTDELLDAWDKSNNKTTEL